MAIEKLGARQSPQSDCINVMGHKKGKGMVTKRARAALKRARRDQSEGGRCALSKICSVITVLRTKNVPSLVKIH